MEWHDFIPPADERFGIIATAFSFGFFYGLDRFLCMVVPPKVVTSKGTYQVLRWRNLIVSLIHALLIGFWDLSCFHYYPTLMDDLVHHVVPYTYYLVSASTGYFLFDFWVMYSQNIIFQSWELSLHHFAVLSTFIYNLLTVKYIAYTVVALLAEVNSFFLHSRKLLQMCGAHFSSPIYRLNAALNLITFAACRGYCLYRISYGIYTESDQVSFFYLIILCISMCIMNVLNPVLFWILLRNDFLRVSTPSAQTSIVGCDVIHHTPTAPLVVDRVCSSMVLDQLHDKASGDTMLLSEFGLT